MARQKVHERRIARESALALLYSSDITERKVVSIVEEGAYPADDVAFPEYAEALVNGVAKHRAEIDAQLASTSENWALDRMPVVDRAILRLAVYEMMFVDDVPISVAINEAVELAKLYGGEDESARFVNGILGRISRAIEGAPDDDDACAPADLVADDGDPAPADDDALAPADPAANDGGPVGARTCAPADPAATTVGSEGASDAE